MNLFKSLFASSGTSLNAVDAKARLDTDRTLFVLDVRQPEEFRAGHIPGATLIPLNKLGESLKKLPQDRDILCVCRSGSRSSVATRQLNGAGYNAINLSGGMSSWERNRFPVKQGK